LDPRRRPHQRRQVDAAHNPALFIRGILSPLLANIALSVLDEHFAEAWQSWGNFNDRSYRRRKGMATYRLVRYADLCRTRHRSAYAEHRIMLRRRLDRRDAWRSRFRARHNPGAGFGSEAVEVGQQRVGRLVSAGRWLRWRCHPGEGTFLDRHVGMEVDLGRFG